MPWPIPPAKDIAEKMATALEHSIQTLRQHLDPLAISRAVRSARGMFAMVLRVVALELRGVHDHVAWWGRQYFVDTAEDEFVVRHGDIWGVDARDATHAVGPVLIEGTPGAVLPAGLELSGFDAAQFVTLAPVVLDVGGQATVSVRASVAGVAGNVEAGIRLRTITPAPDIDKITIAAPGIAGGADAETPAEHASAIMAHIRQPPHGGAGFDYPAWLRAEFPVRAVETVTDWIGRGSVGVVVAMKDGVSGRAPTPDETTAMLDYLGPPNTALGVRPVTAHVVVVPAEIVSLDIAIRLRPDTVATRAAVEEAFRAYVLTIGDAADTQNSSPIGAIIEPSRISEAISAASGEYGHDLVSPPARYTLDRAQYPVAGTVTFEDPL